MEQYYAVFLIEGNKSTDIICTASSHVGNGRQYADTWQVSVDTVRQRSLVQYQARAPFCLTLIGFGSQNKGDPIIETQNLGAHNTPNHPVTA